MSARMQPMPELLPESAEALAIAVRNLRDAKGMLLRLRFDEVLTKEVLDATPVLRQLADAESLRSLPGDFLALKVVNQ